MANRTLKGSEDLALKDDIARAARHITIAIALALAFQVVIVLGVAWLLLP